MGPPLLPVLDHFHSLMSVDAPAAALHATQITMTRAHRRRLTPPCVHSLNGLHPPALPSPHFRGPPSLDNAGGADRTDYCTPFAY
eukprot:1737988-Pleurochrysis_carterae.AAC.1